MPFWEQLATLSEAEVARSVSEFDIRPTFPESVPKAIRSVSIDSWLRRPQRRPLTRELVLLLREALAAARPEAVAVAAAANTADSLWSLLSPSPPSAADSAEGAAQQQVGGWRRDSLRSAVITEIAVAADEEGALRAGVAALRRVAPKSAVVLVATLDERRTALGASRDLTASLSFERASAGHAAAFKSLFCVYSAYPEAEALAEKILAPSLAAPLGKVLASTGRGSSHDSIIVTFDTVLETDFDEAGPEGDVDGDSLEKNAETSLAHLLATARTQPVSSATADQGIRSFLDWSALNTCLPAEEPGTVRQAWATLLHSNSNPGASGGGAVVGFALVVWASGSDWFEVLSTEQDLECLAESLGGMLMRCRNSEAARLTQREKDAQQLQQKFLRSVSHELRTVRPKFEACRALGIAHREQVPRCGAAGLSRLLTAASD